ncbi:MAG: hypothetical protein V1729_04735 [Candidatus Woesearchaeota archaeon]
MLSDNKKRFVYALPLVLIVLLALRTEAIGISPADAYVNFVPNYEYVIDYSITSYRPFDFYTEGPLSEYTRIEELSHSDTQGSFRVYLTLPDDYDPPGKHRMYVAAKERLSPGTVNTIAAIRGFIEIDVPFPGYYAEMQVNVPDVNVGEPIQISATVLNRGKLNISTAKIEMKVTAEGKNLLSMESENFAIDTTGGYTFYKIIEGDELKAGTYLLEADLFYEGKKKTVEEEFKVGTFDVNIVNYTRQMFNNTVNLFEINVESLWNNRIDTVYMDLSIMNGSKVFSTVKTPPFDLLPWQTKRSEVYWNTDGIPLGEYTLEIVIHYGSETRTENRKIYIVQELLPELETPVPVSTVVLVTIALMLVIFNIYFIVTRRKKDDKGQEKSKGKKESKSG